MGSHLPCVGLTWLVVHLEAEVKSILQILQVPEGSFGFLRAQRGQEGPGSPWGAPGGRRGGFTCRAVWNSAKRRWICCSRPLSGAGLGAGAEPP